MDNTTPNETTPSLPAHIKSPSASPVLTNETTRLMRQCVAEFCIELERHSYLNAKGGAKAFSLLGGGMAATVAGIAAAAAVPVAGWAILLYGGFGLAGAVGGAAAAKDYKKRLQAFDAEVEKAKTSGDWTAFFQETPHLIIKSPEVITFSRADIATYCLVRLQETPPTTLTYDGIHSHLSQIFCDPLTTHKRLKDARRLRKFFVDFFKWEKSREKAC